MPTKTLRVIIEDRLRPLFEGDDRFTFTALLSNEDPAAPPGNVEALDQAHIYLHLDPVKEEGWALGTPGKRIRQERGTFYLSCVVATNTGDELLDAGLDIIRAVLRNREIGPLNVKDGFFEGDKGFRYGGKKWVGVTIAQPFDHQFTT